MANYKIICPECSAIIVTAYPEALLWERCPHCMRHVWDNLDMMMADADKGKRDRRGVDVVMRVHSN